MFNFTKFLKMDEKKKQKIVVFVTLTNDDKNLILNGIKIADIFNKELCLVFPLTRSDRKNRNHINIKINEYLVPLAKEMPLLKTSVLIAEENLNNLPDILAGDYEGIILIARASDYKKFSTAVTFSPVPFLFIDPGAPLSAFQKIVMPIDIRKENSDVALWCSWFGRFAKSKIIGVAANEKGRDSQRQIAQNVMLIKKLFQKTGVNHKLLKGEKSSLNNSFEALNFAINSDTDLLVVLGSSVITPLDWIIGLPERKIIHKAGQIPVLLVNPRRDNYILCD